MINRNHMKSDFYVPKPNQFNKRHRSRNTSPLHINNLFPYIEDKIFYNKKKRVKTATVPKRNYFNESTIEQMKKQLEGVWVYNTIPHHHQFSSPIILSN